MPKINSGFGKTLRDPEALWAMKCIGWYDYLNNVTQPYPLECVNTKQNEESIVRRKKSREKYARRSK